MFEDDPQLSAFVHELRDASDAAAPPVVGAALAAVLEGRETAVAPAWVPRSAPRRRRSGMRWVIGGAVFGLGIGSLGVAGALPDPVQRQVANLGEVVGVELPEPAQDTPATSVVPTTAPPSTVPPARASHPTTTVATTDDDGSTRGAEERDDHGPTTTVADRGRSDDHRRDGDGEGQPADTSGDDDASGDEHASVGKGGSPPTTEGRSPTTHQTESRSEDD